MRPGRDISELQVLCLSSRVTNDNTGRTVPSQALCQRANVWRNKITIGNPGLSTENTAVRCASLLPRLWRNKWLRLKMTQQTRCEQYDLVFTLHRTFVGVFLHRGAQTHTDSALGGMFTFAFLWQGSGCSQVLLTSESSRVSPPSCETRTSSLNKGVDYYSLSSNAQPCHTIF